MRPSAGLLLATAAASAVPQVVAVTGSVRLPGDDRSPGVRVEVSNGAQRIVAVAVADIQLAPLRFEDRVNMSVSPETTRKANTVHLQLALDTADAGVGLVRHDARRVAPAASRDRPAGRRPDGEPVMGTLVRTAGVLALAGRQVDAAPADLFAGARYRQRAIRCGRIERAIELLQRLARKAPTVLELRLNLALAHVDKVPTEGDFGQAMLGRAALKHFERSIAVHPTWLAYHTRGVIYLFYPTSFDLTDDAIENLERALAPLRGRSTRPYHARTYVALGDAHLWRRHDEARARAVWQQGLELFPTDLTLQRRAHGSPREVRELVDASLNADVRIDTSLRELMGDRDALR